MTDKKLKRLNELKSKRDDLVSVQAGAGRTLAWDPITESDNPTPESCRDFVRYVLCNKPDAITGATYRKMWGAVERDIDVAVKRAERDFDAA